MEAITPADADQIIESQLTPLGQERVPFDQAYGRILREPVLADRDFPPFNRVMMDGIAIQLAGNPNRSFSSAGIQRAGVPAQVLPKPGSCFEVMTGAVLPERCDTVIPIEEVTSADGKFTLRENYVPTVGQFVHRQGSDNHRGDLLLAPGQLLSAKEIAVLATCGYTDISVTLVPRVSIVSTGDELVEVRETPGPFQIRKSNVYALEAACLGLRTPVATSLHHLPDNREIIAEGLASLVGQSDVLLFSGGISKGKYDFLQELLVEAGVTKHFQWVRQRPGKPLWFGTSPVGATVFALPGNPNSTLTCFYRYVVPAIYRLSGCEKFPQENAALATSYRFDPPLTQFLPVVATRGQSGRLEVEPLPTQNSGDLAHLALSTGFIELPADPKEFPVGFTAPYFPW